MGFRALEEDDVPNVAWIDEIEWHQFVQLKPLLSERSVRTPFSADSADADGCERIAIFLIRNPLVTRKEQVRLIRYEGKRSLERKLLMRVLWRLVLKMVTPPCSSGAALLHLEIISCNIHPGMPITATL